MSAAAGASQDRRVRIFMPVTVALHVGNSNFAYFLLRFMVEKRRD